MKPQQRSTWDVIYGIIFLHNIRRFWAPVSCAGHFGSVGMIMRILTIIVIVFIARCTEQIVYIGNVWYVPATEVLESSPRHGVHYLRFLLFVPVPVVRGLVAGQCRPKRLPAHPLQTTKIDSSHYSTLYSIKYCFIPVNSKFNSAIRSVHFLVSSFFQIRTTESILFWQQATTDRQYLSHGHWLCTKWIIGDNGSDCNTGWTYLISVQDIYQFRLRLGEGIDFYLFVKGTRGISYSCMGLQDFSV